MFGMSGDQSKGEAIAVVRRATPLAVVALAGTCWGQFSLPPGVLPTPGGSTPPTPNSGSRSGSGVGTFANTRATGPMPKVVDPATAPPNTALPAPPASAGSAAPTSDEGGIFAPAAGEETEEGGVASDAVVRVADDMTVEMHLADESLSNVLQLLAMQSQRNIIASKGVNATVSANLYGVTLYEALDSILKVNGYGYVERGNFIYVYTLEELEQIKQADRRPIGKVIQLNYLNANDAAQFVTPLLSEIGQIKTNGDVDAFFIAQNPVGNERFALSATLVVFDYPEHVEEIERLVRQLDARPAQVLVEATILQTRLTESNAFGVDFSIIAGLNFTDFIPNGGPLSVFNGLQSPPAQDETASIDSQGTALVSTPGNTNGPGTLKVGIVDDNFALFVRMLDDVADTTVLSNPKLLALNRQPAKVLVGRKIGYLSTTATETATTQTVEFLDTGTQLSFRPFISNDGMIRMELRPSVSQGFIRTTNDPRGQPVSIPDEETQEITTNVLVRDGQTIVLGGLFKETTTLNRRQVPVIGDVPIIGVPFRGHDDSTDRVEIIFLITPTIVNDRSLLAQGERGAATVERVRAGSRQGLLPWSRDRMTAKLNVEAEELARQGKKDEALWKLRRSLELNPVQPDAMRQREALDGTRDVVPSRSFMEDVIGGPERGQTGSIPLRLTPARSTPHIKEVQEAKATPTQTPEWAAPFFETMPASTADASAEEGGVR